MSAPDEYYKSLGRLTFRFGALEHYCSDTTRHLTDPSNVPANEEYVPLSVVLKRLKSVIEQRFSRRYIDRIQPLIDQADALRKERNKNFHALWQVFPQGVTRFSKDAGQLSVATPTPAEIEALAVSVNETTEKLAQQVRHAYDMDEKVREWRERHGR
ncbi:hypothetical protein [Tardiphaga robiniae]|uniref:Uncharacterized protein n=1 Tax=Tardiphaga robiniae TaxID=943830 RepID=A0A7G6TVN6_9BRAD|nr:hypothetical protein [Tardiphaga robiniae]QND70818.1 hypothetical protein HB776_05895 [Tardiphaga robiniae]